MAYNKGTTTFGVIGLGRFGFALAETLAQADCEVLVLDNDESKVRQIQDKVDQAFVVGHLDRSVLEESGIQNCQTVIVCIGEHIEASILTTLSVIEMGVPRVIAKAISAEHGKVLRKIGAEVVYPERDRAVRLARALTSDNVLENMDLGDQYSISEIKLPRRLAGQTLAQADIRRRFHLNIIAINRDGETKVELEPDSQLLENDLIVVIGKQENIRRFTT